MAMGVSARLGSLRKAKALTASTTPLRRSAAVLKAVSSTGSRGWP